MPRFFLNIFNDDVCLDEEGQDLPDLATAKDAAIKGVRELIADGVRSGLAIHRSHHIDIIDESGALLQTVKFGDQIHIVP